MEKNNKINITLDKKEVSLIISALLNYMRNFDIESDEYKQCDSKVDELQAQIDSTDGYDFTY